MASVTASPSAGSLASDESLSKVTLVHCLSMTQCCVLQNIWEARPNAAPMRHNTLDKPLATYPSLCNPQGLTHYPSLSSQNVQSIWGSPACPRTLSSLQGLDAEGSVEFMPGNLSSVAEDDVWAAQQMSALRGTRSMDQSVDQSMPFGSSPERMRLLQHDYNTQGSERYRPLKLFWSSCTTKQVTFEGIIGNCANGSFSVRACVCVCVLCIGASTICVYD